jgi:hypothetical protein
MSLNSNLCQCWLIKQNRQCQNTLAKGNLHYCSRHQKIENQTNCQIKKTDDKGLGISWGIKIMELVTKVGYQGNVAYTLGHDEIATKGLPLGPLTNDDLEDEEFVSGVTICLNVAEYLRWWLGDTDQTMSEVEKWKIPSVNVEHLMSLNNGIYYMEFEGTESHGFIWIITDSKIYYCGGYGGIRDINFGKFKKEYYFHSFVKAMNGDLNVSFCFGDQNSSIPLLYVHTRMYKYYTLGI